MFTDSQSTNDSSDRDVLVGGGPVSWEDGKVDDEGTSQMAEGGDASSTETPYGPQLVPLSILDQSGARDRRRRIGSMAPAALLLPLAMVSLAIYLLRPSWLGGSEPVLQARSTEPVPAVTLPSVPVVKGAVETPELAPPHPEDLERLLNEADALVQESELEKAIEIYQELVRRWPDDARPEIGWAKALLLAGLPDLAISHAWEAWALDPTNIEAAIALAWAYVGVGDKTRALSTAESALGLDVHSAEAHAVLAEAYHLNGQFRKAIEAANLALAEDRNSAEAHRVRGRLYEAVDNDLEKAIREFRLAADLQPKLWLRHYELGIALLQAEENDEAVEALTEAWVLRRTLSTYGALGQAYYRLGEYDRAASYLEQSLSAGAWNADTYALLASIRAQRGRCGDAMAYVKHALTQDPNHPLALEARDTCLGVGSTRIATPTASSATSDQVGVSTPLPPLSGWIAFPVWNVETDEYDTYVADVESGERRLVIEGMHQPAFSPDGQWLAVNGERPEHLNLFIVRPDGSELQEITENVEDGLPCWSPISLQGNADGLSLAFSSTRHGDKQSRIYILDRVPFDGRKVEARPLNYGPDDVRGEYPAWTVDAGLARVVYSGCHYDGVSAQCGLMLMSAELGPQIPQPLTTHPEDRAPAAYGSQISFMSSRDGNWEVYLVNSDGLGLKRLTHNASNDGLPTWSPDGGTIAFVSDEGGTWAIWIIRPDGSGRRKLFDIGGGGLETDWQHERISWEPDSASSPSPLIDVP